MSAIERVLEERLMIHASLAFRDKTRDKYWTKRTIDTLDAALEYWLMKRDELLGTHDNAHFPIDLWDSKEGWTCDCLDK